jgi:L-ascorbate metabolism protein UlaG (beta-lactamase superfamily)
MQVSSKRMFDSLLGILCWLVGMIRVYLTRFSTGGVFFMILANPFESHDGAAVEATRLRHIGHASFEWTTPSGTRIVIDPYRNSWWSHWFEHAYPPLPADLVLVTHSHFDHDATGKVSGNPEILRQEGIKHGPDYLVEGIAGRHARSSKYGHRNLIFVVEIANVRFCHWGDNDAEITDKLRQALGRIDVLMLPVDESEHLLTLDEVSSIIKRLSPRVVIPMHYFEPGLTCVCSTLRPIDNWLKTLPRVSMIEKERILLSRPNLPETTEVWVFKRFDTSSMPSGSVGLLTAFPCLLQAPGPWVLGLCLLAIMLTWFLIKNRHRRKGSKEFFVKRRPQL